LKGINNEKLLNLPFKDRFLVAIAAAYFLKNIGNNKEILASMFEIVARSLI